MVIIDKFVRPYNGKITKLATDTIARLAAEITKLVINSFEVNAI